MSQSTQTLDGGRYRLERVLGEGGMAAVYLAWDSRLKVHRAVKVLHPRFASQAELRERFEREAQAMARIRHDNVLTVHDVGHDGERVFMVMELEEGGSLADVLRDAGTLEPARAVAVCRQLLSALAAAHALGIVHRDIKPHNVLLSASGDVRLADFGIALLAEESVRFTKSGASFGTFAYMAPEQAEDTKTIDHRADLYAVGATLYALLTGKLPRNLYNEGLADRVYDGLPPAIVQAIQRATRYDADERYADAARFDAALADLEEAGAPTPRTGALPAPSASLTPTPGAALAGPPTRPSETLVAPATHAVAADATDPAAAPTTMAAFAPRSASSPSDGTLPPPPALQTAPPGSGASGRGPWLVGGGLLLAAAAVFVGVRLGGPTGDGVPSEAAETSVEAAGEIPTPGLPAPGEADGPVSLEGSAGTAAGDPLDAAGQVEPAVPSPAEPDTPPAEARPSAPAEAPAATERPAERPAETAAPAAVEEPPETVETVEPAETDAPPATPATVQIWVASQPPGALVVDGTPRGATPQRLSLTAGDHVVELSHPEHPSHSRTLRLDPTAPQSFCWDFAAAAVCARR